MISDLFLQVFQNLASAGNMFCRLDWILLGLRFGWCSLFVIRILERSKNSNRAIHKDLQDKRKVACGLEP